MIDINQEKQTMKKALVLVFFISVILFITSCAHRETKQIETKPEKTAPSKTPSVKEQPNELEQSEITPEPVKQKTEKTEAVKPEPEKTIPSKTPSVKEEPNKPEQSEITPEPLKQKTEKPEVKKEVKFHNKCSHILSHYVDDEGMVNYSELRRKRIELRRLADEFENLDPKDYESWPKNEKKAFWINAYNIQMLNIIIDHYPIKSSTLVRLWIPPDSIRHIGLDVIWNKSKFLIMHEQFTLSMIEKNIFQKQFDEPRLYFGLCAASLSSPPLRNKPYTGEKLDKQLDDQIQRHLRNPYGFKIDYDNKKVYLSTLFHENYGHGKSFMKKYSTDKNFKDKKPVIRAVLNFISQHISSSEASFLATGNYSVDFMKYNWKLNE